MAKLERDLTAAQRREAALLNHFSQADEAGKKIIEGTAAMAAKMGSSRGKS